MLVPFSLYLALSAAAPPWTEVTVGVRHTKVGMEALEQRFWAVATPGHALYRQYSNHPSDFAAYLSSDPKDISDTMDWLHGSGCRNCETDRMTFDSITCECLLDGKLPTHKKPAAVVYVYKNSQTPKSVTTPVRHISTLASARAKAYPPNHGTPARQKASYKIPDDLVATNKGNLQEVWGCGTFGVNKSELAEFYKSYSTKSSIEDVIYGTENHGTEGGDNFVEGTLDTTYISSFGVGVRTVVSNTNTSMATEEGEGQGIATVYAMEQIAKRTEGLPHVLSLSLGSLGYESCVALCKGVTSMSNYSFEECHDYIQTLRQVCLYASSEQQDRINTAFKVMGMRGTTVLGASGDGGSHWSFGPFSKSHPIGKILNTVGCSRQSPLFPAQSPYIVAVGGVTWENDDPDKSTAWACQPGAEGGSGGGFSDVWGAPSFQHAAVKKYLSRLKNLPGAPPPQSFNASGRAFPDVSAFMDGVPLCFNGMCHDTIVGGTSASTPTFAGIISLINDHRLNKGFPTLGYVVPRIWQIGIDHPGEAFADITSGNTSCGCSNGFVATEGWDPLTGFGQPIWPGLVKYLGDIN